MTLFSDISQNCCGYKMASFSDTNEVSGNPTWLLNPEVISGKECIFCITSSRPWRDQIPKSIPFLSPVLQQTTPDFFKCLFQPITITYGDYSNRKCWYLRFHKIPMHISNSLGRRRRGQWTQLEIRPTSSDTRKNMAVSKSEVQNSIHFRIRKHIFYLGFQAAKRLMYFNCYYDVLLSWLFTRSH